MGKQKRPPGPRGSLLLGNAPAIARDPLAAYSAMAREYGDIVRIRFVFWPTYLLFHPDHVRHVLQEKHTNYSKDLYTYRMLRPVVAQPEIATSAGGPMMEAMVVPELKMPVANARSPGGNHSATALIAAGKFPLSPRLFTAVTT